MRGGDVQRQQIVHLLSGTYRLLGGFTTGGVFKYRNLRHPRFLTQNDQEDDISCGWRLDNRP